MVSRGVNKVILIGNLGRDPEIRYIPNGNAVANFSLATSESWRDKQTGEIREKTEWHRVVVFGKLAEIAGEYLRKGSQVYIEGSLQTRKWQDQEGQDHYYTEVIVNIAGTMQMLGSKSNNSNDNKFLLEEQQSQNLKEKKQPTNVDVLLSDQIDKFKKFDLNKDTSELKDSMSSFDDDEIPF